MTNLIIYPNYILFYTAHTHTTVHLLVIPKTFHLLLTTTPLAFSVPGRGSSTTLRSIPHTIPWDLLCPKITPGAYTIPKYFPGAYTHAPQILKNHIKQPASFVLAYRRDIYRGNFSWYRTVWSWASFAPPNILGINKSPITTTKKKKLPIIVATPRLAGWTLHWTGHPRATHKTRGQFISSLLIY